MQATEGLPALPVQRRHVDVEDAEKAVCFVLDAGRAALRCPRHASGDADRVEGDLVSEHRAVDPGDLLDEVREGLLRPDEALVLGEEDDNGRGNELLKSPTAFVPTRVLKA